MKMRKSSLKHPLLYIAGVLAVVALLHALGFGSIRVGCTRIGYAGNETPNLWSGRYALLDGTMYHTLSPKSNCLTVTVETNSGSLSIRMEDEAGNTLLDRENLGTQTLQVAATGRVSVQIRASKHRGSFRVEAAHS